MSSVFKLLTLITFSALINPSEFIMGQVNETHLVTTFYYSGLNTVHVLRMASNSSTPLSMLICWTVINVQIYLQPSTQQHTWA